MLRRMAGHARRAHCHVSITIPCFELNDDGPGSQKICTEFSIFFTTTEVAKGLALDGRRYAIVQGTADASGSREYGPAPLSRRSAACCTPLPRPAVPQERTLQRSPG